MKLDKICEALSQTDELGLGLPDGCAVAQLFIAAGKSEEEIRHEMVSDLEGYKSFFGELLVKEYDMTHDDVGKMYRLNDKVVCETQQERHKRVLDHYENELIECLISESSSQAAEELKASEDVSIAL